MARPFSILPACLLSFLLVMQPFSALLYAQPTVSGRVKLIYTEAGKEDEKCQIKRSDEKEGIIEILDEDLRVSRTVQCDSLEQILVLERSGAAGLAAGGAAGGCIGATIGAFFFGIGAIPGALIGIVLGTGATAAVGADYYEDVKSVYCGQQ